uniref:Cytochrome c oxidase assembly protein COX20, mitochondrial n=1 Tax=Kalmanozyma brasiliensis (strain GHG001) TaxID=1365824 RepID=V5F2M6_KALBG
MSRLHEASQPRSDGSESTVGATGAKAEATKLRAALSSISPISDLSSLPRVPCARGSLLMGMATAAGVAGISLVAGRGLRSGLNWGVGSFCFLGDVQTE